MNNKQLRIKFQAILMSGLVIFFIACHNSDYTKNAATGSDTSSAYKSDTTSANKDTTMNKGSVTDTNARKSSTHTSMSKKATATKKKGKITIGSMAPRATMKMKPDKEGVYSVTEVMPAYPGGQTALEDYMNNSVEYPQTAIDNNSEGIVKVQFVVDENGKVTDVKSINKVGSGLDDEAIKVISNMPKWTPGKVKGKNVKTRVELPVSFKLVE